MGLGVIARACAAVYLVVISYALLALYVQHGTVKKDRLPARPPLMVKFGSVVFFIPQAR